MSDAPAAQPKTTPKLAVSTFRLQNFKAVRDSGVIEFTPLTCFVGGNGVGKSSIVEGLEMVQTLARDGLDKAVQKWRGFEYISNRFSNGGMRFEIEGKKPPRWKSLHSDFYTAFSEIVEDKNKPSLSFFKEELKQWGEEVQTRTVTRSSTGLVLDVIGESKPFREPLSLNTSVLYAESAFVLWQFLRLNPEAMMQPQLLSQVAGYTPLATDGSNIAEYLLDIHQKAPSVLPGIVETVQSVLPYVDDLQPVLSTETGRFAHLKLREQSSDIPSWLFSSGTLRLVALLALFRHPQPPPLIVIEEIENGLDPSAIAMIVEEMREVVRAGKSQIIITTHSPYLMNLLPLKSLMLVERVNGEPRFYRPADDESLKRWSRDFAPGDLYTMGRLQKNA